MDNPVKLDKTKLIHKARFVNAVLGLLKISPLAYVSILSN